jgi:hypothetical protein
VQVEQVVQHLEVLLAEVRYLEWFLQAVVLVVLELMLQLGQEWVAAAVAVVLLVAVVHQEFLIQEHLRLLLQQQ